MLVNMLLACSHGDRLSLGMLIWVAHSDSHGLAVLLTATVALNL